VILGLLPRRRSSAVWWKAHAAHHRTVADGSTIPLPTTLQSPPAPAPRLTALATPACRFRRAGPPGWLGAAQRLAPHTQRPAAAIPPRTGRCRRCRRAGGRYSSRAQPKQAGPAGPISFQACGIALSKVGRYRHRVRLRGRAPAQARAGLAAARLKAAGHNLRSQRTDQATQSRHGFPRQQRARACQGGRPAIFATVPLFSAVGLPFPPTGALFRRCDPAGYSCSADTKARPVRR
jgi:hypothetical protein